MSYTIIDDESKNFDELKAFLPFIKLNKKKNKRQIKLEVKNKIIEVLINHKGKENAINVDNICKEIGINITRSNCSVREIIKELIEQSQYPICLNKNKPKGIYIAKNSDEIIEAIQHWESMRLSLGNRIRALQLHLKKD